MEYNIAQLFPTAILRTNIQRTLSSTESSFMESCLEETYPNTGNKTSIRTDVLEDPTLLPLKHQILEVVNKYVNDIINPRNPLDFYITQSWLNETNKDGFHHKHCHANSILSGVFYTHANPETDKIFLYHPRPFWDEPIKILTDNFNEYNSTSWWLPVSTGDIILFPSGLQHSVETLSTDKRVSLAFNTWFRGKIGDERNLTQLDMT